MFARIPDPAIRLHGRVALLLGVVLPLCAGCSGEASTLDPAGREAEVLADLWWWMALGAAVVWTLVIALAVYAARVDAGRHDERQARLLIVAGGAIFPTVVLGGLLAFGLDLLPDLLEPGPEDGLRIEVSGERWWWRVRYVPPEGEPFELANEIRLPVDERVEFALVSPDVIHSFWIPSLGGKIDMIPGRRNRLALTPTRTGTFRGECAEYCGLSHALMHFPTVVMEREAWEAWAQLQRQDAAAAEGTEEGRALFLSSGCGACHTVRGTPATGRVGPDLTHFGSRLTIAAGTLPNDSAALVRWLADPSAVKPGVEMPAYGMLPEQALEELAAYLGSLR